MAGDDPPTREQASAALKTLDPFDETRNDDAWRAVARLCRVAPGRGPLDSATKRAIRKHGVPHSAQLCLRIINWDLPIGITVRYPLLDLSACIDGEETSDEDDEEEETSRGRGAAAPASKPRRRAREEGEEEEEEEEEREHHLPKAWLMRGPPAATKSFKLPAAPAPLPPSLCIPQNAYADVAHNLGDKMRECFQKRLENVGDKWRKHIVNGTWAALPEPLGNAAPKLLSADKLNALAAQVATSAGVAAPTVQPKIYYDLLEIDKKCLAAAEMIFKDGPAESSAKKQKRKQPAAVPTTAPPATAAAPAAAAAPVGAAVAEAARKQGEDAAAARGAAPKNE